MYCAAVCTRIQFHIHTYSSCASTFFASMCVYVFCICVNTVISFWMQSRAHFTVRRRNRIAASKPTHPDHKSYQFACECSSVRAYAFTRLFLVAGDLASGLPLFTTATATTTTANDVVVDDDDAALVYLHVFCVQYI